MQFEWDERKAELNRQKHGITFHEAATDFGDPLAVTFQDPDHFVKEFRYITFDLSRFNHLLVVSHSDRPGTLRIISARRMTKNERKIYERG